MNTCNNVKGDIIVVGVNHHRTPLHLRERFSVTAADNFEVVNRIAALPHIRECVVLSTCNRTEVYAVVSNIVPAIAGIENFLAGKHEPGTDSDNRWLKLLRSDALLHLFRVASGLESMILGESQILAQVKNSHKLAARAGTIGPILEHAFQSAIACGKRVRSNTEIGHRPVSVSSAAVQLGREMLGGTFRGRRALVIGVGEMAGICSKHLLADPELQGLKVISRSNDYGALASCKEKFGSKLDLQNKFAARHLLASQADLVLVATSAPHYVLTAEALIAQIKKRDSKKTLCIIDISVPRNVEPDIAAIEGVKLLYADDLSAAVSRNKSIRESVLLAADSIVFAELDAFASWQRNLATVPTIKKLRVKIEDMRVQRLERIPKGLTNEVQNRIPQEITRQLVNQILHEPTEMLRACPNDLNIGEILQLVEWLFQLKS